MAPQLVSKLGLEAWPLSFIFKEVKMDKVTLFFKKHGPTILSITGTLTTLISVALAIKATPKAIKLIEAAEEEKGEKLTTIETIKVAAPVYIPTALTTFTSVACTLSANVLNEKSQAHLSSMLCIVQNQYSNYRKLITEKYGEEADFEVVKQHVEEFPEPAKDEDVLTFFEWHSSTYFQMTWKELMEIEDWVNDRYKSGKRVSVSDYLNCLGICNAECGNDFFLRGYDEDSIEFRHEHCVLDDGMECIIVSIPELEYYRWI